MGSRTAIKIILAFVWLGLACDAKAQLIVDNLQQRIDVSQSRLDKYDGQEDKVIDLSSEELSHAAGEAYLIKVDLVQEYIKNSTASEDAKKAKLNLLLSWFEDKNADNYAFYIDFQHKIELALRVEQLADQPERLEFILQNDVHNALDILPFFAHQPFAAKVLLVATGRYPLKVLRNYQDFAYQKYAAQIVADVALKAPFELKEYFSSSHPVNTTFRNLATPAATTLATIRNRKGTNSKAYVLLHDIHHGNMTIDEAHVLMLDDRTALKHLLKLAGTPKLMGRYSVEKQLNNLALKAVREINELHNERSEAIRYAAVKGYTSAELYALMVYSESEIFTSSYLELFDRMMTDLPTESSFEFLHQMGMVKFRTFIKMCAGFGTLDAFTKNMSLFEQKIMFDKLAEGIESLDNSIEEAVALGDTYGSLKSDRQKTLLRSAVEKQLDATRFTQGEKLYALLLQLFDQFDHPLEKGGELMTMASTSLFKNGEHVQQHFFYDDEDGITSYRTFIETFSSGGWKIIDKGTYVLIESVAGKKVKIYANKAKHEYEGQAAIKQVFETNKRWPDVVVHRGHSYYAHIAIGSLTPNAEVVFLGSCGGYHNVAKVLDYAPNARIISSKQVGTYLVNNTLSFQLCETIRLGKDINWYQMWNKLDNTFGSSGTAAQRFAEYVPPHKNIGALFIKAYLASL